MNCRDCIYWKEEWIAREETCHFEQKTIRKYGDDFCSHFISQRGEEAKQDKANQQTEN